MQTKLENKQIIVYHLDGSKDNISRKDGVFVNIAHNILFLKNFHGNLEGIPLCRVIRFVEKN